MISNKQCIVTVQMAGKISRLNCYNVLTGKDVDDMNKFDTMSKDAMNRVEEIMNSTRLNEFLHRKEQEEKKKNNILWVFAIIGAVAAVAAIAYGVYRFFTPDYLEDFEDDFDDDFDDDFFEDDLDSTSK